MRRFLFRLAVMLHRTVGELEGGMTSAELSEWMAFAAIEPLPDPYWMGAQLCSVVANSIGGAKTKAEDFIPRPAKAKRSEPGGDRPTAEQSAGILGRKFRENEVAARKRIEAMNGVKRG